MGLTFYLQIHREKGDLRLATQAACSACHFPRDYSEMWEWLHLPLSMANKRKWKTPNVCPHSESRTGEGHLSQQGRRGGSCPQPGNDLGMQNRGCGWASSPGQASQGPCQPREPWRDQYESTSIHAIAVWSWSLVRLFVAPRTVTHQAPLSATISWSLLKFRSIA